MRASRVRDAGSNPAGSIKFKSLTDDVRTMSVKPTNYIRIIKGRPINLEERAPSFHNELLRRAAKEYWVGAVVPHIQYLISEAPINQSFWSRASYSQLEFKYKGKKINLTTNHGSEECMRKVIEGNLDISDWVLDLFHLTAPVFHPSGEDFRREEYELFKNEVQEQVKNGIEKYLVE